MNGHTQKQVRLWKRVFATGLAATALFLSACGGGASGDTTETETPTTATEKPIVYIAELTEYRLICTENANTTVNRLCLSIRTALQEKTGTRIDYKDDFVRGDNVTVEGKEILVGHTDRKETAAAMAGLTGMQYRIRVDGDKIVIVGGSDAALSKAVELFIEEFITGGNAMVPETFDETYSFESEDFLDQLRLGLIPQEETAV